MQQVGKNVLIIAYHNLAKGGVQSVIKNITKLSNAGYHFDIIIFDQNVSIFEDEKISNINFMYYQPPKKNSFINKIIWHIFSRKTFYKKVIKSTLNKKKYDIIHSFKEFESYIFFKVSKRYGIKKRILHVNVIHTPPSNILLKLIWMIEKKHTLKYTTNLIFVSELSKKALLKKSHKIKSSIIYNTYDESKYSIKECTLPHNFISILHVASFSSNKNQLFSIEIFKELILNYPNAQLTLLGFENEIGYFKKMKTKIEDLSLSGKIVIYDDKVDPSSILSNISCYILPSIKEAAPVVSVEAQSSGLPIYTSTAVSNEMDCGGLRRIPLSNGAAEWAKQILDDFRVTRNKRIKCKIDKFSSIQFLNKIKNLYEL